MRTVIASVAMLVIVALGNISSASAAYRCGYWTEYRGGTITNVIGPPCGRGNGWQHGQNGRYWGQRPVYGPGVIVGPTITIPGRITLDCNRGPNDYLARDEYGRLRCFPGD